MGLSCGVKLVKILLFIVNALVWAMGLTIAIVSLVFLLRSDNTYTYKDVKEFEINQSMTIGLYVMLALGIVVCIVGFAGCCGALMENICLLVIYAALIGVVLLVDFILVIAVAVGRGKMKEQAPKLVTELMKKYKFYSKPNITNPINRLIDEMQSRFLMCCGSNDSKDWEKVDWYKNQTKIPKNKYPKSCCIDASKKKTITDVEYQKCLTLPASDQGKNRKGCGGKLGTWVYSNSGVIIVVLVIHLIVHIIVIALTVLLLHSIRKAEREGISVHT